MPIITIISTSFTDWYMLSKPNYVGLKNYINLFTKDKSFMQALINTIIWIILQSTIHVSFGTLVALILSKKMRGWKFVRTVYMIPNILSAAALGMLFLNLLNPTIGLVNSFIRMVGFKDFTQNWYADSSTAFFAVTMTTIWYAGVVTILVMAEIASISETIIEAARIDGATGFQTNIYITLPLLKNIIGTVVIISAISIIKSFDIVFLTTSGGPGNSTLTLPLYLYKTANLQYSYGIANTIGTIQLAMGISIILIITKIFRIGKTVED